MVGVGCSRQGSQSHLSGGRSGWEAGEAGSMRVKVMASCLAISQPLSHKPAAENRPRGCLQSNLLPGHPISLLQLAGDGAEMLKW